MELRNKRVLVVGFGRTGESLCRFLIHRDASVRVGDRKSLDELGARAARLAKRGVAFETGHPVEAFLSSDLVVLSPGVPPLPEAEAARKKGIPVISEIELAYRFLKGKIVAVTGSNGKSTTTTLAHKILSEAGLRAFAAGNIGIPLISFADKSREDDIYVTEISSFQLENIAGFKAGIAAFLNISENHLDWHKSFDNYFAAKKKILLAQTPEDHAVLNRDDERVWELHSEIASRIQAFSRKRKVARGAFIRDGEIVLKDGGEESLVGVSEVRLPGVHNLENVMAASLIGRLCGVPARRMRTSIRSFRGLEHRLENVLSLRRVLFVNDSKATTVDATIKALASFDRGIVLILGGKDKGADFTLLRKHLARKVRKAVLVGQASDKIENAIRGSVAIEKAVSYRDVVRKAFAAAEPGDVVLLAPACTSWDMFADFEQRGRTFKREVRALARKIEGK